MAKIIATIGGVGLAPGISKNRRLYTREHIAGAVARARKRLADGTEPMVMLTHHGADDDSTAITASLTDVSLDEDGKLRWTAGIADTKAGQDIASLTDTTDGRAAHLKNVSIRGHWLGTVRRVKGPDGEPVETADGLEIDGLDFTRKPGVAQAAIDTFAWADRAGRTETTERIAITESVEEAHVAPITEETVPVPVSAIPAAFRALVPEPPHVLRDGECITCAGVGESVPLAKRGSGLTDGTKNYADPGYQADKKQRYDLSSRANAKAAWSYINQAGNAKAYSAAQLKRVKARIIKALKSFGVTVSASESAGWAFGEPVSLDAALAECYSMGCDPEQAGSWSISASNGPVNLCLSAYRTDPAELDVILRAAADAACKALAALDPDMDGDIDVDGAPNADTDHDGGEESAGDEPGEAAEAAPAPAAAEPEPEARETTPAGDDFPPEHDDPAPEEAAGPTTERTESAMTDATPAAETTAAPALSQADIDRAVSAALAADREARRARKASRRSGAPAETTAPAATPAAETTAPGAPVQETEDQLIERLVREKLDALVPQESDEDRITRLVSERVDAAAAGLVQSGALTPARRGIVRTAATETATAAAGTNSQGLPADWADKPMHQYTPDEMRAPEADMVDYYTGSGRAARRTES